MEGEQICATKENRAGFARRTVHVPGMGSSPDLQKRRQKRLAKSSRIPSKESPGIEENALSVN